MACKEQSWRVFSSLFTTVQLFVIIVTPHGKSDLVLVAMKAC